MIMNILMTLHNADVMKLESSERRLTVHCV